MTRKLRTKKTNKLRTLKSEIFFNKYAQKVINVNLHAPAPNNLIGKTFPYIVPITFRWIICRLYAQANAQEKPCTTILRLYKMPLRYQLWHSGNLLSDKFV